MQTSEIEQDGAALATRSLAVVVVDATTYAVAAEFLLRIKAYRAKVAVACDPVVEAAHATHKAAVALKKNAQRRGFWSEDYAVSMGLYPWL